MYCVEQINSSKSLESSEQGEIVGMLNSLWFASVRKCLWVWAADWP